MKRLLVTALASIAGAGTALAADLPQPAPPPPRAPAVYTAPAYNWAGFYIGVNGGYGFGSSTWSDPLDPAGSSGSFHTNGGIAGGTVGVNFQSSQFVFGIEGDFDWQGLKGTSGSAFCTGVNTAAGVTGASCQTQSDWIGTLRARAGFAADRVLFYATGGGVGADVQAGLSSLTNQSKSKFGWTAGAGIEGAFAENWTAKIEYLYADLGTTTCNSAGNCGFDGKTTGSPAANDSVKFTESLIRAGVNYKFSF
jgi:outer membrane immunogenic protein